MDIKDLKEEVEKINILELEQKEIDLIRKENKAKYVLLMEKKYSIAKYIRRRVYGKNKNFIVSITGQTGSGKSYSALSIGEMLDHEFGINRIIFKAVDFMRLLTKGEESLPRGAVIVWDEAGIDLSNRNWQSLLNKLLNNVIQTFRHRNIILIFTVPYGDFVDSATRKLFHAEFRTVNINMFTQKCELKPKFLQYNSELKKWYAKYLKVNKNGGYSKIKRWYIPKASDELIEAYEKKRRMYTTNLNDVILESLEKLEGSAEEKLTDRQKEILGFWKRGVFSTGDIAKEMDIIPVVVSKNIKYMKNKGINRDIYRKAFENGDFNPLNSKNGEKQS